MHYCRSIESILFIPVCVRCSLVKSLFLLVIELFAPMKCKKMQKEAFGSLLLLLHRLQSRCRRRHMDQTQTIPSIQKIALNKSKIVDSPNNMQKSTAQNCETIWMIHKSWHVFIQIHRNRHHTASAYYGFFFGVWVQMIDPQSKTRFFLWFMHKEWLLFWVYVGIPCLTLIFVASFCCCSAVLSSSWCKAHAKNGDSYLKKKNYPKRTMFVADEMVWDLILLIGSSARILKPWVARISMNPPMMPFLGRSTHITITAAATTSIIIIIVIIIIVVVIIIIQVPPCLLLKPTFILIESTCLLVKSLFIPFDEILDSSKRMHDYPPVNYQFTIENDPFVADLPWFTS